MKQLSDKTSDQWIDLKGPNSGSGKIHIQHLYFEKTSEINFEEEFKIVFQYYLKEVEGTVKFASINTVLRIVRENITSFSEILKICKNFFYNFLKFLEKL